MYHMSMCLSVCLSDDGRSAARSAARLSLIGSVCLPPNTVGRPKPQVPRKFPHTLGIDLAPTVERINNSNGLTLEATLSVPTPRGGAQQGSEQFTCSSAFSSDDATFDIRYNSVNRDDVAVQFGWCSSSSYDECQKFNHCSSSDNLKQHCSESISNDHYKHVSLAPAASMSIQLS